MKNIIFPCMIFLCTFTYSQNDLATASFTITGKVKSETTVTINDLQKYRKIELEEVNISCSPRKEDMARSVTAILLKDILDSVVFIYENPSMLNHYYFLFKA